MQSHYRELASLLRRVPLDRWGVLGENRRRLVLLTVHLAIDNLLHGPRPLPHVLAAYVVLVDEVSHALQELRVVLEVVPVVFQPLTDHVHDPARFRVVSRAGCRLKVCKNFFSGRFGTCISIRNDFVASYCWTNCLYQIHNKKDLSVNYLIITLLRHQYPAVAHILTHFRKFGFRLKSGSGRASKWGPFTTLVRLNPVF